MTASRSDAARTPSAVPSSTGERELRAVVGGTRPDDVGRLAAALLPALESAGQAASPLPVVVPIGPGEDPAAALADIRARLTAIPPATAVLLRTSGSTTGTGSLIAMGAAALLASARATQERLGGPAQWVLPLPAHHVAGLQILVRSWLAGAEPLVLDTTGGFAAAALGGALEDGRRRADAAGKRLATSLVPTQLRRVLDDPDAARALALADAVLVGGAATAPALLERARAAGVRAVTTYGMSETGGGCVYDGLPLRGVSVRIEEPDEDRAGRVVLSGPVLAEGYASARTGGFRTGPDGARELATSDRGRLVRGSDGAERLEVLGRIDDVIVSGGMKIAPADVEAALLAIPGIAEACAAGVPDPEWGSAVVAAVVPEAGRSLAPEAVRIAARERLDGAHAPKRIVVVDALPLRGPGKPDRRAVAALLAR